MAPTASGVFKILTFTLGALAMRVGATIKPEHMELLRSVYGQIRVSPKYSLPLFDSGFRGPIKKQFEQALKHYKSDGTPVSVTRKHIVSLQMTQCLPPKQEIADSLII
jgi:hypothetical protein